MNITADANVLFSTILREGLARKVWFNTIVVLYAPAYLLAEFQKYDGFLRKKFSGNSAEFDSLVEKILGQVTFVSDADLIPYLPAASSLILDSKDWLYLACALKENTIIWSQDRGFQIQTRVPVKTTAELARTLGTL